MFHSLVTSPAAEPIDLEEAKLHLRVDGTEEDGLINGYIRAARRYVEGILSRQLVTATWSVRLDRFPSAGWPVELNRPPVQAVSAITYLDNDGAAQTLLSSDYGLDLSTEPARVIPVFDEWWPDGRAYANAVSVTFRAGYITPIYVLDPDTDLFTAKGRTFASGDLVRLSNSGGQLPEDFESDTDYYVRDVSGSSFKLAATSGGTAIAIPDSGDGTHFIGVLPETIRQAILLLIGHYYEQRAAVNVGNIVNTIPLAVESLLGVEKWEVR